MDAPADTLNYFIAGYAVIFISILGYLASLVLRRRNLIQDEEMLRDLEKKGQ
jgi:CcmD family protein